MEVFQLYIQSYKIEQFMSTHKRYQIYNKNVDVSI